MFLYSKSTKIIFENSAQTHFRLQAVKTYASSLPRVSLVGLALRVEHLERFIFTHKYQARLEAIYFII
jgi:hypothetical protein